MERPVENTSCIPGLCQLPEPRALPAVGSASDHVDEEHAAVRNGGADFNRSAGTMPAARPALNASKVLLDGGPASVFPATTAPAGGECATRQPDPISQPGPCCSGSGCVAVAYQSGPRPAESTSSSTGSNTGCVSDSTAVSQGRWDADYAFHCLPQQYEDAHAHLLGCWHRRDGGAACGGGYPPPPLLLPPPPPFLCHSSTPAVWCRWDGRAAAAAAAATVALHHAAAVSSAPCSRGHSLDGSRPSATRDSPPSGGGAQVQPPLPLAMHPLASCRYFPYARPTTTMPCATSPTASAAAARWSRPVCYPVPSMSMPPLLPTAQWTAASVQLPTPPPPSFPVLQPQQHSWCLSPATCSDNMVLPPAAAAVGVVAETTGFGATAAAACNGGLMPQHYSGGVGGSSPDGCPSDGVHNAQTNAPQGTLSQPMRPLPVLSFGYGYSRRGFSTGGRYQGCGQLGSSGREQTGGYGHACSSCGRRGCSGAGVGTSAGGGLAGGTSAAGVATQVAPIEEKLAAAEAVTDGVAAMGAYGGGALAASPFSQNTPARACTGGDGNGGGGDTAVGGNGRHPAPTSCRPHGSSRGPVRHSLVHPAGLWAMHHRQALCSVGAPPPSCYPPHPGSFLPSWPAGASYDGQPEYEYGYTYDYDYELMGVPASAAAGMSGGKTMSTNSDAVEGLVSGSAAVAAGVVGASERGAAAASGEAPHSAHPPAHRLGPVPARFPCFWPVSWQQRHPLASLPPVMRAPVHRHPPYGHAHPQLTQPMEPWLIQEP